MIIKNIFEDVIHRSRYEKSLYKKEWKTTQEVLDHYQQIMDDAQSKIIEIDEDIAEIFRTAEILDIELEVGEPE